MPPSASIVVPTRARPAYLEVTLASIAPQARRAGAEVIVVDDGGSGPSRAIAEAHGVRHLGHPAPLGPNAARNTGFAAAGAPLLVLVDDDVEAPEGWLDALLHAAAAHPEADVVGGPIRPRLDGVRWRTCGREAPPISALDLGPQDREVELVYSANMLIRRSALDRIGPFADSLGLYDADETRRRVAGSPDGSAPGAGFYGDEEEWQRRLRAAGGHVRYAAAAGLVHRREGADARLPAMTRAAYARGRMSRRWAEAKGPGSPPLRGELRVLAGCVAHAVRLRCANGVVLSAAAAGRVRETLAPGARRP